MERFVTCLQPNIESISAHCRGMRCFGWMVILAWFCFTHSDTRRCAQTPLKGPRDNILRACVGRPVGPVLV